MADDPYASLGSPVGDTSPVVGKPKQAASPAAPVAPSQAADPYAQVGSTADAAPADPATDHSTQADAQPQQPLPGFSDDEKQAILGYIPHAKDAADLERFASELTQGHRHIGNAQAVLDARDKGHKDFAWQAPTVAKPAVEPTHDNVRDTIGEGIIGGLDSLFPGIGALIRGNQGAGKAFTEHAANALAMDYGPEVGGLIDTIIHPGSTLDNNVAHERAQITGDSQGHDVASTLGELTGAAGSAMLGNEAGVANLGRVGKGVAAAGEGAAYGSGAAGPDHRIEGGIVGGALGAGTEAAVAGLAARSAAKTAAKSANQDFAQAADRQGIDYMAADLPKATKSKFATALSALTLGGIPLADQGAKNVGTAAAATERVAGDIGTVADKTGAGQAAQRGAKQFMASTEGKMGELYDAIPIGGTAPAVVTGTRSALNDLAQSFSSNPKLAAAFRDPKIAAYLDALTPQIAKEATGLLDAAGNPITRDVTHGGGLSWNDLKDFRTRIGQIIGKPGLTSDGAQINQLRALYGSLSDDMRATAANYGPQASRAFERANTYARARAGRIDNVVSLILGKEGDKAPQSAFEALQRFANEKGGDPLALARALRSMPEDEAGSVRATILDNLGHGSPGTQNAAGDVFSPAQFVTNWNKLSDRAKNVLFTGDHRAAINDLVNVFSGMKTSSKFANTSKTGIGVIASTHTVPTLIANPVVGLLDMALQYGGGKLLSSPAFARKIAGTPKNLAGARAYWSRPWVQGLQVKNPAIAGEIQAFQHAFLNHANDNTGIVSAASAEPDQQQQQQ